MKTIDNFAVFSYSPFNAELEADEAWVIHIITRSKDFPSGHHPSSHTIKTYFITSPEDLNKNETEIKTLCDTFGARAYISVNPKSLEQATLQCMRKMVDRIEHRCWSGAPHDFLSAIDSCRSSQAPTWLIDLDYDKNDDLGGRMGMLNLCTATVAKYGGDVKSIIHTPNGVHLLTSKFNTEKFWATEGLEEVVVYKNAFTLLYSNTIK